MIINLTTIYRFRKKKGSREYSNGLDIKVPEPTVESFPVIGPIIFIVKKLDNKCDV